MAQRYVAASRRVWQLRLCFQHANCSRCATTAGNYLQYPCTCLANYRHVRPLKPGKLHVCKVTDQGIVSECGHAFRQGYTLGCELCAQIACVGYALQIHTVLAGEPSLCQLASSPSCRECLECAQLHRSSSQSAAARQHLASLLPADIAAALSYMQPRNRKQVM